jgi:hypothetical protein
MARKSRTFFRLTLRIGLNSLSMLIPVNIYRPGPVWKQLMVTVAPAPECVG